jgi:hypothetical protein
MGSMPSLEWRRAVNFKYEKMVKKNATCPAVRFDQGAQRNVVYLGLPIAPSYMSPNAGECMGGGGVAES